MKILVLTNMYPTEDDLSFGTFVSQQVEALRANGIDIDVLFVNGRANRWNYLLGIWRLWRTLWRNDYDLVHAHHCLTGFIARFQWSTPVVISFHGGRFEATGVLLALAKRLARTVDACTVTSTRHQNLFGDSTLNVIPCGVDLNRFQPVDRDVARQKVGWTSDKPTVLWLGDPRPEKRVDRVRAAFEVLKEQRPNADLKVVSGVPHDEVGTYLNAADVLALTSDTEGSPVIIKEAMACNLPIVSVDVGDVEEVVSGTKGCSIVSPDPEGLAEGLRNALDFGQRSDGRVNIEALSIENEALRLISLYEQVLSRRNGKQS